MAATAIEWTESTWNPVTGCSKLSPGCHNCYAERMARRLQHMGQERYATGFAVACHPEALELPLRWRRPQMVFVNSMSDLFHEDVPEDFLEAVFDVMSAASWHRFQLLTKRSARLVRVAPSLPWPDNLWVGVSVETRDYLGRLDDLRQIPASVRFVSFEPLLAPVGEVSLAGIGWVIVGGESGPGARPMKPEWALEIRDQCQAAGVPFFFKQWGGFAKKRHGRVLDGRTWDEWPVALQDIPLARGNATPSRASRPAMRARGATPC